MKVKVKTHLDQVTVEFPYKERNQWITRVAHIYPDKIDGVTVYIDISPNTQQLITNWGDSNEILEELEAKTGNSEIAKALHDVLFANYEGLDEEQMVTVILEELEPINGLDIPTS